MTSSFSSLLEQENPKVFAAASLFKGYSKCHVLSWKTELFTYSFSISRRRVETKHSWKWFSQVQFNSLIAIGAASTSSVVEQNASDNSCVRYRAVPCQP